MRTILRRLAVSALLILLACAAHGQAAYTGTQETFTVSASGAACVYGNNSSNSGCFQHNNSVNELNYTVAYDLIGSPTITSIVLQGCMSTGNICDTLNTYTGSTNTLIHGGGYTYDYWIMTPTWSSCGSPPCSVKFEWRGSSNSSPGGGTATQASQVQGTAASGAASSGDPVQIAGVNSGTLFALQTDASGNAQVVGTAAAGSAAVGNPVMTGGVDTSGNARAMSLDVKSHPQIRTDAGNPWSCFITLSTNTTTQCQAAAAAGTRNYVMSALLYTTTAGTSTTVALEFGTGTNCGTGTTALTPAFPNTALGLTLDATFPVAGLTPATTATEICAIQAGTTAGTTVVLLTGFTAP